MRRIWSIVCALLLMTALFGTAAAQAEVSAWGSVQDQTAILYLPGAGEGPYTCQVGSASADVEAAVKVSDLETPVETVILLDNSLSIQSAERPKVKEILSDLIANRLSGERYTIATISNDVSYLCRNETDYTALKAVVEGLEFKNQYTQLSDGLYLVLEGLRASDEGILRRLLIIADGVDNKQIGYTKDELHALIRELGYPIYTVGCTNRSADGTSELQELYALSRLTPGAYYSLPDVQDTMDIVSGVTAWNEAVRLTVNLPDEVCDGMSKALRVEEAEGGRVYLTQLTMPMVLAQATPEPEDTPEPDPAPESTPEPEQEPESRFDIKLVLLAAGAGLLLVIVIVVVIVLAVSRRKKNRIEEVPEARPQYAPPEQTEFFMDESDGRTDGIWDQAPSRRLVLEDLDSPSRRIEVPLRGSVTVGRDASACQVVLTEPSVARQQCRIYEQNGWIMICNLSRSNITKLDGQAVLDDRELRGGSTLQMGRMRMRVEIL